MTTGSPPTPEGDLSVYVLSALDGHLAAMRGIRDRMRVGGVTVAGGRRELALESIVLAEHFAAELGRALGRPAATRRGPALVHRNSPEVQPVRRADPHRGLKAGDGDRGTIGVTSP